MLNLMGTGRHYLVDLVILNEHSVCINGIYLLEGTNDAARHQEIEAYRKKHRLTWETHSVHIFANGASLSMFARSFDRV